MAFSKDFLWGAASSAYQIEGGREADGTGKNIWDEMGAGYANNGENGDVACDHYNRYLEDVAIMKELGLKSYRFSVSWSRIFPQKGVLNPKGLEFYSNLVDALVDAGIEPMVTVFHWDLPMWIHEEGGWACDWVSYYFEDYTRALVEKLGDRVTYWMTINEPQMFIGLGYVSGRHAPFEKTSDPARIALLTKNAMLAHGKAVKTIRAYSVKQPKIGMAPTGSSVTPLGPGEEGIERARQGTYSPRAGVGGMAWWADPIILGKLPTELQGYITQDDLDIICQPLDFFGFNIYQSQNYAKLPGMKNPFVYPGLPRSAMEWPVTPECLYWTPKFHYERYGLPILITENGYAGWDFVMRDGKVHDPQREDYIYTYLHYLKKAVDEGIPVIGYQYWSLLDNYEWTEGYDKRFGLVYVDYRTQKRTIKDSAYAYAEIIKANGENL